MSAIMYGTKYANANGDDVVVSTDSATDVEAATAAATTTAATTKSNTKKYLLWAAIAVGAYLLWKKYGK